MAKLGEVRIPINGSVQSFDVVDLADCTYSAFRMPVGGTIGAIDLLDVSDANASPVRVATPQGIKALAFQPAGREIDSFERGNLDPYTFGSKARWDIVTSPVWEGTYSLEGYGGNTNVYYLGSLEGDGLNYYPQPGDTIRYRTLLDTASAYSAFSFGKTTANANDEYRVYVDKNRNLFQLVERASSDTNLDRVDFTPTQGIWYEVAINWGSDGGMDVTLYSEGGELLHSLSATSTTYTGRGISYRKNGRAYFDHVRAGGGSGTGGGGDNAAAGTVIEDFESGNIDGYRGQPARFSAQSTTVADGTYALHGLRDGYTINLFTLSDDAVANYYPQPGDTWRWKGMTPRAGGLVRHSFGKSTDTYDQQYQVDIGVADDIVRLTREDPSGPTNLQVANVVLNANQWYDTQIAWGTDGSITVDVYEEGAASPVATVSGTDTTYTGRGFMFTVYEEGYFDTLRVV